MTPAQAYRLPPALEPAVSGLKLAVRSAVERTIECLGLAALAAGNAFQRDGLLAAQFELNRKSAVFVLRFNESFDERVLHELGMAPRQPGAAQASPPESLHAGLGDEFAGLSLVADHEVENQITAERFGLDVAHACEWELREFDAFVAAILESESIARSADGSLRERNPLRPQVIGQALLCAVDAVSERQEVRKQLTAELSRSLGTLLRKAYADIVAEMRRAGVHPRGLSLRAREAGASTRSGFAHSSRAQSLDDGRRGPPQAYGAQDGETHGSFGSGPLDPLTGVRRTGYGSRLGGASSFGASAHAGLAAARRPSLGMVDPALATLLRRLAQGSGSAGLAAALGPWQEAGSTTGFAGLPGGAGEEEDLPPVTNLIMAHREELRRASRGSLDHMVIDVIAGLFDQILSDPKVPPQMARQIARLQLPVLRAALGDTSFFSSRRHPVRRFINRIASLGAAFDDYSAPAAQRFLAKVRALVQQVAEGDFEQIELYEEKLRELEAFIAAAPGSAGTAQGSAAGEDKAARAAELLAQREDELRLRQLYAQRLEGELRGLGGPAFVHDFITSTWSQVLVRAAGRHGADSAVVQRMRQAGRELFMSVQPKANAVARKAFLASLPRLMQDLTEGMNLIAWPEPQRREFFGLLMPAHAEALRNTSASVLDVNLLARQVEAAMSQPLPSAAELRVAGALAPPPEDAPAPALTPEEAQQVGLLEESAVDWSAAAAAPVDIEIDLPQPAAAGEPLLPGAPLPAQPEEAPEPTQGQALAEHVQLGHAYHMELQGQWHKVRLAHMSPGRSFFVFSHGSEHAKKTISLTRRMLERLCAAGRLRAFEQAYLIERATARARRQLAQLAVQGA